LLIGDLGGVLRIDDLYRLGMLGGSRFLDNEGLSTDVSLLFLSGASRASTTGGATGIHDSSLLIGLFIHEAEDVLLGLLRDEGPVG
jgi:hypothetical protein